MTQTFCSLKQSKYPAIYQVVLLCIMLIMLTGASGETNDRTLWRNPVAIQTTITPDGITRIQDPGNLPNGALQRFRTALEDPAAQQAASKKVSPQEDTMCIYAEDFGNIETEAAIVEAKGNLEEKNGQLLVKHNRWINSQINPQINKPLSIDTYGAVTLDSRDSYSLHTTIPTSHGDEWISSNVIFKKGYTYTYAIQTTGWWSNSSSPTEICSSDNFSNCQAQNGAGIVAVISKTVPVKGPHIDEFSLQDLPFRDHRDSENNGILYYRYLNVENQTRYYSPDHKIEVIQNFQYATGMNGQFLLAYIGEEAPDDTQINPLSPPHGYINLHPYHTGDKTATPPLNPGSFRGYSPASGKLWFKIIDKNNISWNNDGIMNGDGAYDAGNQGFYKVKIKATVETDDGFSTILNRIVNPVKKLLRGDGNTPGLTESMYKAITANTDYVNIVRITLALSITFYALAYIIGLVNANQKELIAYGIKISLVITLIGPTSWEFFYQHLFSLFVEGMDDLLYIFTSQFASVTDGSSLGSSGHIASTATDDPSENIFNFLNQTIAMFFTKETNIKISALLVGFPIGWILAFLLYVGMAMFMFVIIKAVLIYITSIIMISLMLFLAPLVIVFILFQRTKDIFETWVKILMAFVLQPVLLFMVIGVFNIFIFSAFYSLLSYSVCQSCVFSIDLPISEMLDNTVGNFDKFCVIPGYTLWGMSTEGDVAGKLARTPIGLFAILIFMILCGAMLKLSDWVTQVATSLTAGVSGVNASLAATRAIGQAAQGTKAGLSAAGGILKRADTVTGHVVSDKAKTVARKALPRSEALNFLTGGRTPRGGSDGMGGQLRYKDSFMTTKEKRALKREQQAFSKLSKEQQEAVKRANEEERTQYKALNKSERKAKREEKAAETKKTGSTLMGRLGDSVKFSKHRIKNKDGVYKTAGFKTKKVQTVDPKKKIKDKLQEKIKRGERALEKDNMSAQDRQQADVQDIVDEQERQNQAQQDAANQANDAHQQMVNQANAQSLTEYEQQQQQAREDLRRRMQQLDDNNAAPTQPPEPEPRPGGRDHDPAGGVMSGGFRPPRNDDDEEDNN